MVSDSSIEIRCATRVTYNNIVRGFRTSSIHLTLEYGYPSNTQSCASLALWLFLIMAIVTGSRARLGSIVKPHQVSCCLVYIGVCVSHGDSHITQSTHMEIHLTLGFSSLHHMLSAPVLFPSFYLKVATCACATYGTTVAILCQIPDTRHQCHVDTRYWILDARYRILGINGV